MNKLPLSKNINDLQVVLDQSVPVYMDGGKKFNGLAFEIHKGYLAADFEVISGVRNGLEKRYFKSGQIESILSYSDGLLDGSVRHFYENGSLEEESYFLLGVCVESKCYDQLGLIKSRYKISEGSSDFKWLSALQKNVEKAQGDPVYRVAAGEFCQKSGYWITMANVDVRRFFKKGDVMPSMENPCWETIWYWDKDQNPPSLF